MPLWMPAPDSENSRGMSRVHSILDGRASATARSGRRLCNDNGDVRGSFAREECEYGQEYHERGRQRGRLFLWCSLVLPTRSFPETMATDPPRCSFPGLTQRSCHAGAGQVVEE